uniref:Uncharacterized protein n=1 Tax=Mimivirus LCMiAC01 TaxID=2506608 RepID=A0A481YZT1_9VIRU|nr:MAG: hypothetical protein LCMiAC01_04440 [Mimivirus LCMiAC01]
MPKYYHIHRSPKPSKIETKLKQNQTLYFSRKNSFWYNVEQRIGKEYYGGYIIYEINIPKILFTTSFNPIKNKIVKITKKNINEYKKLTKQYKGSINFIKEMKKRNIIGIDATSKFISKHRSLNPPEGYIWKFPNTIKIKKIKVYDIK